MEKCYTTRRRPRSRIGRAIELTENKREKKKENRTTVPRRNQSTRARRFCRQNAVRRRFSPVGARRRYLRQVPLGLAAIIFGQSDGLTEHDDMGFGQRHLQQRTCRYKGENYFVTRDAAEDGKVGVRACDRTGRRDGCKIITTKQKYNIIGPTVVYGDFRRRETGGGRRGPRSRDATENDTNLGRRRKYDSPRGPVRNHTGTVRTMVFRVFGWGFPNGKLPWPSSVRVRQLFCPYHRRIPVITVSPCNCDNREQRVASI